MKEKLREIATWLRTKADESLKHAQSRESSQDLRNATVAELKQGKALAEKMGGRKMPYVTTDLESHRAYCDLQDRIAAKLNAEAKQLSEWADVLEAESVAEPQSGENKPQK